MLLHAAVPGERLAHGTAYYALVRLKMVGLLNLNFVCQGYGFHGGQCIKLRGGE